VTEGRLLRQLFQAGAKVGGDEFRRVAEEVIRYERAKNHHLLANDLERILYGSAERMQRWQTPSRNYDIPKDRERGLPLIELREPQRDLNDIVLTQENRLIIEEVLLEQNRRDLLGSYGLRPAFRLLFCGPPGCGKTLAAEVLATELSLHLAIVRFDAVISSFLGETAANLRKVFEFMEKLRVVALFDEFDTIGKSRSDPTEHGELKRVVNSFLQMIDSYRGDSVIIAATNHEQGIDPALWRRFDEVLVFRKPNLEQIRDLIRIKLRGIRYELPLDDVGFLRLFDGLSHADIERILMRAAKLMILRHRQLLTSELVQEAKQREEYRQSILDKPYTWGG